MVDRRLRRRRPPAPAEARARGAVEPIVEPGRAAGSGRSPATAPARPPAAPPATPATPPAPRHPDIPLVPTRRLLAASFDLLGRSGTDMRRASFYIGLIVLGTVGPLALASWGLVVVETERGFAEFEEGIGTTAEALFAGLGSWRSPGSSSRGSNPGAWP